MDLLVIVSCASIIWAFVCVQRLWIPARIESIEEIEGQIYKTHVLTECTMTKVGGLGTVHVPYCGEKKSDSTSPPIPVVLVHGFAAGNVFWATVQGTDMYWFLELILVYRTCKHWQNTTMWYININDC
jgi:hypothetical protein